ncbi:hypothetical protein SAMN05216436_12629 [bacterium A37T11]|nr:hypothetical protein SAMN05216436_12629 [bacterium A37T11]
MKKLLSVALIGVVVACQQPQKKENSSGADKNAITCEAIGPVKLSYSHADLEKEFGADKLIDEDKQNEKNVSEHITRVFKDSPEEVTVYWSEKAAPYAKATKLAITNEGSPYTLEGGIGIGASLSELKSANNFQPITFSNFFAHLDGFGRIKSFNGGDLGTKYPCLGGMLDIEKQKQIDVNVLEDFKKQEEAKSSDKAMEFMDVKLVELSISAK